MKTSTIIYLILGVALMSIFFGNIYYHKVNFDERRPTIEQEAMLLRLQDSIRVVSVTDPGGKLFRKLTFLSDKNEKFYEQHSSNSEWKIYDLYKMLRFSGDTLFVEKSFLIDRPELNSLKITLNLLRLEKYYYNGKLIKTYTHP